MNKGAVVGCGGTILRRSIVDISNRPRFAGGATKTNSSPLETKDANAHASETYRKDRTDPPARVRLGEDHSSERDDKRCRMIRTLDDHEHDVTESLAIFSRGPLSLSWSSCPHVSSRAAQPLLARESFHLPNRNETTDRCIVLVPFVRIRPLQARGKAQEDAFQRTCDAQHERSVFDSSCRSVPWSLLEG